MKQKTHLAPFVAICVSLAWLLACVNIYAEPKLYFVHSDHLGTPQVLTDENQTVVWKADYTPFGEATVDEDPDGDGVAVEFNLRFPGQYFDKETQTNYNYFRTYDPSLGRYIQSDPIGLNGGINTYGYGLQNSLRFIDPYGLESDVANPVEAAAGLALIVAAIAGNPAARELFSDLGDAIADYYKDDPAPPIPINPDNPVLPDYTSPDDAYETEQCPTPNGGPPHNQREKCFAAANFTYLACLGRENSPVGCSVRYAANMAACALSSSHDGPG